MTADFDAEFDAEPIISSIFEADKGANIEEIIVNAIAQLVVYALALCPECTPVDSFLDDITRDGRDAMEESEGSLVHEVCLKVRRRR